MTENDHNCFNFSGNIPQYGHIVNEAGQREPAGPCEQPDQPGTGHHRGQEGVQQA